MLVDPELLLAEAKVVLVEALVEVKVEVEITLDEVKMTLASDVVLSCGAILFLIIRYICYFMAKNVSQLSHLKTYK